MNLTQLKGAVDLALLRYNADESDKNKEVLEAAEAAYQKAYAEENPSTTDKTGEGAGKSDGTSVTGTKSSNSPAVTAKTGAASGNTAQSSGVVEKAVPDPAATTDGTGSAGSPEEKKSE